MIRAKKSLGQNFLVDENMLKKIVSIIKIENRSILEVGPGTGNLTSCILKNNPKKLIVIEKDNNLVILLKKKFKDLNFISKGDKIVIEGNQDEVLKSCIILDSLIFFIKKNLFEKRSS